MNDTVRLPDCPARGHERSRVERLLPLTRVTRISYRECTIQQYATRPGRDTAPGFLFRRLRSRRRRQVLGKRTQVAKLQHRARRPRDPSHCSGAETRVGCDGPSVAAALAVARQDRLRRKPDAERDGEDPLVLVICVALRYGTAPSPSCHSLTHLWCCSTCFRSTISCSTGGALASSIPRPSRCRLAPRSGWLGAMASANPPCSS
jgi:hypothetical protein